MAKFCILLLCIVKVVCAVKTTTPPWDNVDLIANYLRAFPVLINMSSQELGLPEGVDFKNPKYSPTTPSVTEKPTTFGTEIPVATMTSAYKLESTNYEHTTPLTNFETESTGNYEGITASSTYFLNTTLNLLNTSEIQEIKPTEPMFMCYECERNVSKENLYNCSIQYCPSNRCINAFVYSYSTYRNGENFIQQASLIQKCDTGTIEIPYLEATNKTSETNSSSANEKIQTKCGNASQSFVSSSHSYSYERNNVSTEVAYTCCNFTLCNNATSTMIKQNIESSKNYTTANVVTLTEAISDSIAITDLTADPTSHASSNTYSTNHSGIAFNVTTSPQEAASNHSEIMNSSEISGEDLFSGGTSGSSTYSDMASFVATTTMSADPLTTWHDTTGGTTPHASTEYSLIQQFLTTTPQTHLLDTTSFENSGMSSSSGEFSGNLIPELTSPTTAYDLLKVSSQTTPSLYEATTAEVTSTTKEEYITTESFLSSSAEPASFEHTSAPIRKETTSISGMHTSLPLSSKRIETTHAIDHSSQYTSSQTFFRISNSTTAMVPLDVVIREIQYTMPTTDEIFATSRLANSILSDNGRRFDKQISEKYKSRVLLLIPMHQDVTNETFLVTLELKIATAYEKAKNRETASQKAGILSRKLLLVDSSSNIKTDLIMLRRVTNHAVYAEFAIRENDEYLESFEVVSTMSLLTTEELSDILGVAVLSPVIASEIQPVSAWMVSSLTVIPILFLGLVIFCCVKFSKKSEKNTVIKRMKHRESTVERYPIYSSKRERTSRMPARNAPDKCDLKNFPILHEEEPKIKHVSPSRLPPVREEASSQSFLYSDVEEIKHSTFVEEEESSNIECKNIQSANEENYINIQTLMQKHKVESPTELSDDSKKLTHHMSSFLPHVSPSTTALVAQTISNDWMKHEFGLPEISADGVAEIDADLSRMRNRMNTIKRAERSRNKRRIRERIISGNDLKTPNPLDVSIHYPFQKISTIKADNTVVANDKLKTHPGTKAAVSIKEAFTNNFTVDEKQLEKGRKRKKRKLLMAILKDWEQRHLQSQKNHVQPLGPACRLSLDAKMRRWQQPVQQSTITEVVLNKS